MLRRFNYTDRKRISKDDAIVKIRSGGAGQIPIFDIELRLEQYGFAALDPDARVRVEAHRGNAAQRWDFGTVSNLTPPPEHERCLTEAPVTSQFKVVVVADGSGRLLGASQHIKPQLPRESLIPLDQVDLEGEVWRIDFGDGDDLAVLQVNSRLEMISEIARSNDQFIALVMPQVLRTVLTQIILVEGADADDTESPHSAWINFARSLRPGEPPKVTDSGDDAQRRRAREWIDEVVRTFSLQKVDAVERYRQAREAVR